MLQIAIVNLMPEKQKTEQQLHHLIEKTGYNVSIIMVYMDSYYGKNTSREYLQKKYTPSSEILKNRYDGCIITGTPVEKIEFEEVIYWEELEKIFEWTKHHVSSTLHLCWGSMAGLYYHYNIGKQLLPEKISGIYKHPILIPDHPLVQGIEGSMIMPQSRFAQSSIFKEIHNLDILAESNESGVSIISSKDISQVFISGHPEYSRSTLHEEYTRDILKNPGLAQPQNYYKKDYYQYTWESDSVTLFKNWLALL